MKISNKFKECRKLKGYTQKQVAQFLQLDCIDRLSKWENGHTYPHVVNLIKLCRLYEVPPEKIYPDQFSSHQDKYQL